MSAILDLVSATKGFLTPRMTKAEREAIVNPVNGLEVYQTNEGDGKYICNGDRWDKVSNLGYFYAENAQTGNPTNGMSLLYNANVVANVIWTGGTGSYALFPGRYKLTANQNIVDKGAGLSYQFYNDTIPIGSIGSSSDVTGSKGTSCPASFIFECTSLTTVSVKVVEDNTVKLDPTGSFIMIEQLS
jgi:hypothetical protein